MSYDLYFCVDKGKPKIKSTDFFEYFKTRGNYRLDAKQVWYENPDTGIYFAFGYSDEEDALDLSETALESTPASFNLNYFRAHTFALEAEPEVQGFVNHFNLKVHDPQNDGMGSGVYSREGFLKGWNTGNRFSYKAIQEQTKEQPQEFTALPAAQLEKIWTWNKNRDMLQEKLGQNLFVPKISISSTSSGIRSFIVWGDAIPTVIPEVDHFFLVRDKLAPRGFLFSKKDSALADWKELRSLLDKAPRVENPGNIPAWQVGMDQPLAEAVEFFKKQKPMEKGSVNLVEISSLLDKETAVEAGLSIR